MNLRNISAWSTRNPVAPLVLFAALLFAGLLSFNRMDVVNNPDVEFPAVSVRISQPGAAPTEIENQITQLVESAVRSISGVKNISSTASEGSSSTFVEFEIGADVNNAVNEVKNSVDQIRGSLPDGILEPQVSKVDAVGGPIAFFAVKADDMTVEQLSWFVDDTVVKRLLSVDGMAEVDRFGGVDREIRVILQPGRMQALGVTASQINNALRQININAAGGRAEVGGTRQSVRVLGNADDAYALSQTQISLGNGQTIKLSDVADVTDSFGERTSISKVKGVEVVNFSMTRARGASDVTVYDNAIEIMDKIKAEVPGIEFIPLFNSVTYTKSQYKSSMLSMIEGAILAVVVVFIFLRDWRATVISAIAIPLSAIPTFWFMDLLGFNLNFLSLLALGLVAGVLVDDAIVEIENIVRHMRMGKTAYQASIDAADEIGLAVVATSFCIVAVFLPVGLMPGISGQFFKNFGITVVVSVLMSLAVARMITPMVAAYFLKSHGQAEHGEGVWMDRYMVLLQWVLDRSSADRIRQTLVPAKATWWQYLVGFILFALIVAAFVGIAFSLGMFINGSLSTLIPSDFLRAILSLIVGVAVGVASATLLASIIKRLASIFGSRFADWYAYRSGRFRARGYDHRIWMMAIGIVAFGLTVILFAITPSEFQPKINEDNSRIQIEVVPGTTLEQTEKIADSVSDLMYAQPEVDRALTRVRETNATVFVSFKKDRKKTSIEFERSLSPELQKIPDARISFQSQNGGGGTGRDISIMLTGSDPDLLDSTAAQLVEQMKDVSEVRAPRIASDLSRPEIIITPHMDLASQLGVTTASLSQIIRIATLGEIDQNAAKFSLSDRQIPIRVMLPLASRADLTTIENLPIPIATGGTVPLSRVATVSFGSGPTSIQRYNQNRRTFIGADLGPDVVKGDAMEKIFALPIMKNLPTGVSNEAFGEDEWQQELALNFMIALIAGILLVFATLVLLYKRLMSPLVNMGSLALAPLGGMLLVWATGTSLSMPVLIGVLMLLGIVSKNSILLIDFAIEEMQKGVPKFEAIMDAGHKRAQPIVMTTVAMTAGMVPTALSLSGDGAWRAPMGIVVIGGLIVSTLLTLVIVPAGFSLADGFERRAGPWLRKKMLTYEPGDDRHDRPDAEVQPAE
ncbi:efflux RND transporter permease subunit [uncultured Parasphingorhabdus sp.]|uniref:efflux RND transporter permease subunit n=1 Tax=uncultured Parasphingorhabdus sp. TaxID=2709694 RepID=UPI0030D867E1|tara:strand:+ start:37151 stop:40576 length:3426 start_codon:yes stop_codon:yes gene_type:complete